MDGVGETGAETLPSLQSSGAGLGGAAYLGSWATTTEQPHLVVFSAESGTRRPDVSHPRAAQKKKRMPKKK
jgi:hypothetical protein